MSRSPIWTIYWFMFPEHHKQICSKTYLWQPSWKILTYIANDEAIEKSLKMLSE